jgi:hypothetical protein
MVYLNRPDLALFEIDFKKKRSGAEKFRPRGFVANTDETAHGVEQRPSCPILNEAATISA